nr:hypothetical protein [Tanacetum cinerariifolium]
MDLFSLIRAPNPTKVKTRSRSRAPHELPLLSLTASRVIEMDDPAMATDSSGVPSAIERSPLEASDRETAVLEMPPPEGVPLTTASGAGQAVEAFVAEPPAVQESRKRGSEGVEANAPPKSLRRDHADRPSGSSRGGKIMAAMQLCLDSNVFMSEGVPANVSDPDPLAFADAPSPHPADVIRFEQEAKLFKKSVAQVARRDKRIQDWELEIKNLEALLETEAEMKRAAEGKNAELIRELEDIRAQFSGLKVSSEHLSQRVAALQEQVSREEKLKAAFEEFKRYEDDRVEQRCAELDARLDALSIDFDEELYPHMLTAIAGRRWVIGHGLHLTMMKCAESLEMRQAFADVVSAGVAKGMSEGLKNGVEHGRSLLELESIETYDPEAEAKFVAALESLKDLKFPCWISWKGDAPQYIRNLRPSSSQLTIPVYPEVRDPRNPWACKEEIALADAIAANISRAEKKKKCEIVCRMHGVGSAQHAMSDGVPVSVPSVVPQGLALLLVDVATQTDPQDSLL